MMSTQQQFLRFQIQPSVMALMEIDLVTELVNIPSDRIVPMPHLPPAVMGIYNWRGEILWIVNLTTLIGVNRPTGRIRSLQPTIILSCGATSEDRLQTTVGVVVDELDEIEWFDLDSIESPVPDHIYPEFSNWATGLWVSATGENFLRLDGQKILTGADFNADV
jgi:positive phototaxis protein PixI